MTNKALEQALKTMPLSKALVLSYEFHRRRALYKRNLRRYQKRFKQGAYGVQR